LDSAAEIVDTTGFPDGITIYIQCDDTLLQKTGWKLKKRPDQSIVFNISGKNVTLGKCVIETYNANGQLLKTIDSETNQMDDSQDGTDRNKLVEELFLNHITFNAYEATTLTFG